jgi:hypothetical protein
VESAAVGHGRHGVVLRHLDGGVRGVADERRDLVGERLTDLGEVLAVCLDGEDEDFLSHECHAPRYAKTPPPCQRSAGRTGASG